MSVVSCSQSISQEQLLLTACIPASPHPHQGLPHIQQHWLQHSLCLQQPTSRGGSCGMSLADKLYGNLSSLLALSLEVQHSWFRWILVWLGHAAEGSTEGLLVRFAFGGPAVFKSLYFAHPHRVLFVMVSMEGGFIVPPLEVHFQPFPTAFGTGIKLIRLCCIFPVLC